MMGTRAAAFAGKISNLRESILRIQNGALPQPSCLDLANMLKYFCQVLHDFRDFKDIENIPLYASEKKDRLQLIKTLPNFDYSGLYKGLTGLVDVLPLIPQPSSGLDQLGGNLLMLLKCLVPFLDQSNMETMPYLVTSLFMTLPQPLHKEILDTLCFNLLPFTIDQQQKNNAKMLRDANNRKGKLKQEEARRKSTSRPTKEPMHCVIRIEDPQQHRPVNYQTDESKRGESLEDQGISMMDDEQADENEATTLRNRLDDNDLDSEEDEYSLLSVTSILMIAFHYITEPKHHSQLIECLMKLKSNVFEDLLFVIAYGTTRARCPAVEILFRYWPEICPSQQDRKNNSQTNKPKHVAWKPTKCQNKNCSFTNLGDDEAVKMCLDFKISISLSGLPPPMLVCLDCVDMIYKQQLTSDCIGGTEIGGTSDPVGIQVIEDYSNKFIDLLLPMEKVSNVCENKKCKSTDRSAIGTCFDIECANYNSKRPIRYCKNCFLSIHEPCEANNYDITLQNHIRHSSIKLTIMEDKESINDFVEAIISLLKEAAPADRPSKDSERYLRSLMGPSSQFNVDNQTGYNIATEEKQLISQYGIWLMTGLCKSVEKISDELLGRLLGMLFQWFHFTACLPDDQAGSALEKLKGDCIEGWIMGVKKQRLEVFISCLLPHPIDCSKIGGHWEVWPDTAHQIKEGFKRLLCLVPYDIITDDVWDEIMPYWMECFRHEVPENELSELKILLSKVFDPELSPLGFATKQMYHFISSRFGDATNTNQEQTLYWLQIITMLEIPIPIDFLFQMLKSGVKTLAEMRQNELKRMSEKPAASEEAKHHLGQRQHQSSIPTSPSVNSVLSHDSSSQSSGSRAMSVPEDDVMLPTVKEGQVEESSPGTSTERPLTQQERQAQARAAFSAKLMQQASILNAQHSQGSQSTSVSQSSTSNQLFAEQFPAQQPQAQALAPQSNHPHPLKSTSSSISAPKTAESLGPRPGSSSGQTAQPRPKLRLNLESMEENVMNKIDNNLVCYILMLDILLKQLDLQEVDAHQGLEGKEPQQAIELLNAIISMPWIGRHTCCDSLPAAPSTGSTGSSSAASGPARQGSSEERSVANANVHSFGHCAQGFEHEDSFETCVFCEIISTFHQLAMALLEYFSPVIEVSICEVSQDAANGEFDGRPDYSRIGLDHLGPSPKEKKEFDFGEPQISQSLQKLQSQQDPGSPFSPSYSGPTLKREVLDTLPKELQLSYNLLVQFHQYQTPDIVSQLLQMIKLMSLHSQVLSRAAKNNPQFIAWCQHNMLVNKLWSLCQLESSEIARTCVPLLMHCITLPWGVRLFRDLVERDFNSDQWLSRFRAVERVVTIAYFCEPSTIKNSTLLQSTMASAFCYVVRCLDDTEAIVAQRALVSLEMMKTSSLKLLLWCLEVQFDCILIDRPMLLRSVFQLYNHLRDRRFLTWDFFLNRFDTIFLEAQIYLHETGEIPLFTIQDLKNTNTKGEIFQKKTTRAREALKGAHHSRSLSSRFVEKSSGVAKQSEDPIQESKLSLIAQRKLQEAARIDEAKRLGGEHKELEGPSSGRRLNSRSPLHRVLQHGCSTSSRYQSVALLTSQSLVTRKNSNFMANLAMQSVPPMMMIPDKLHQHLPNSFIDDGNKLNEIAQENHVFGVVHRACDEDRDTTHSLIFLLMQFFSKPDPSHPQSIKTLGRSHQPVLRHLNILLGYSVARKNFLISASNLRLLPVFNAFLTSLPKVLDFNYSLGTILLDTCLPVLIYCPAPDDVQYDTMRTPNYSLWLLNPLMRQSWLMSVMAFLYKYQFGQAHLKDHVHMLMWIVVNTLESHLNCSTIDAAMDRCLLNIREQSTEQAPGGEQTSTKTLNSTANNSLVAAGPQADSSATTSHAHHVELSPSKNRVELIEMQGLGKQSPQNAQLSASVASIRFEKDAPTERPGPAQALKPLIKAETSDSLNVKGKLFQRKQQEAPGKIAKSAQSSSSTTKINTEPTETSVMSLMQSGDERLLPIGSPSQPSFIKQASRKPDPDQPVERLLPIGMPSSLVQRPPAATQSSEDPRLRRQPADHSGKRVLESASKQSHEEAARVGVVSPDQQPRHQLLDKENDLDHSTSSTENKVKNNRKRFGAKQQTVDVSGSKQSTGKDHDSLNDRTGASQLTGGMPASTGGKKGKGNKYFANKEYVAKQVNQATSAMQASFSAPSMLNEQLALINRHSMVQEFSDRDISMCLVILETFIHHEPSMAAQMLPNILRLVARYSSASHESWQSGSNANLVGGSVFVARQFIRVALHDLMENNIFHQIFTSHFTGYEFYKSMATSLADFSDLNQLAPLSKLFEDLNKQKNLPEASTAITMLENVATYFECVIAESTTHSLTTWNNFIINWENFLRKLILALPRFSGNAVIVNSSAGGRSDNTSANLNGTNPAGPMLLAQPGSSPSAASANASHKGGAAPGGSGSNNQDTIHLGVGNPVQSSCSMIMAPIMRIILSTTKISHLASCKTIVDPYSKIISYTVLNSHFNYEHLLEINHNCCRLYTRDRDKYLIQRTIAYELTQVLKFRFFILEENLLKLLLFILQDVGGTLAPKVIKDGLKIDQATLNQADSFITNVSECLRQYMSDLLDFITDVHAISRINDNLIGSQPSSINRDSFGGHVKAAISQYIALEMSLNNGTDNRTILRYLPRLYSSPSLQQGPREFIDCISHIRQLSWIILGSLQYSSLIRGKHLTANHAANTVTFTSSQQSATSQSNCQPIPIEKNGNIAEHVQVILAGFAEQSKESVTHMSGLFHAFLLCQLWTMYCENICNQHQANSEQFQFCQSTLDDFWAKITPGVLRLVGHSRVMSEMVGTHFLQLIESLIESNSSILIRYLPMWNSVFYSYKRRNKSGNLAIRLQKCIEWQPPDLNEHDVEQNNKRFYNWLEKVQYKMSHIEIQSSQAAPFYFT